MYIYRLKAQTQLPIAFSYSCNYSTIWFQ